MIDWFLLPVASWLGVSIPVLLLLAIIIILLIKG